MFKPDLKSLPTNPGVYIYKDEFNNIIYVGKAKNLKNRITSYFTGSKNHSSKTKVLVKNIKSFEYIIVDNELESLLLENKLIKKNKPKYNINLKDSKTYAYIKISNEKIPKISISRNVNNKDFFYGPYTSATLRRDLIDLIVKLFKIITPKTFSSKSQLNYQIGLTRAKSLDKIELVEYLIDVEKAKDFLVGKNIKIILNKLKSEMNLFSSEMKFELAQERKKEIEAIKIIFEKQKVDTIKNYDQDVLVKIENKNSLKSKFTIFNISRGVISSKKEFNFNYCEDDLFEEFLKMYYSQNPVPKEVIVNKIDFEIDLLEEYLSKIKGNKVKIIKPLIGDKLKLVNLAIKNSRENFDKTSFEEKIKDKLKLKNLPLIIDCFDMSNLSYTDLVGACTRFSNQMEEKSAYRKFNIKSFKGKNDDFESMREVVKRRYTMILEGRDNVPLPNLILIDGGKGQFRVAYEILNKLKLLNKIDLISIAKGEKRDKNEIYTSLNSKPLIFDNNLDFMLYLRKVRDSVHNFVISFNRSKRKLK